MLGQQRDRASVIVRWSDEGNWAHVAADTGESRLPFLGFVPVDEDLLQDMQDDACLGDDGMWQIRTSLPRLQQNAAAA